MIKILVDSASDIKKTDGLYDYFMPISVNIDGKEYLDGVDIDSNTFYDLLTNSKDFPKTSQPSPQAFADIFQKVKESGDELIYFALSSELSGTYQGANIAKNMVDYDGIYIIDTKSVSHLISVLVRYAVSLINDGLDVKQIIEKCEEFKGRIKVLAGVDTLEFLYRGGRLSKTSATVGKIADIKPIVTVTDGKVEQVGKCLGKGRAMQFIIDKLEGFELDESFPVFSLYTYGEENCEVLENKLNDRGYKVEKRLQVGSTIGTHVGPGVYAVLFVVK